ncbi:MAG: hypothetical protein HC832_00370 [Leptolyngbyaceae cyanobacterium RM1_405_57]|nr:hypothetical protein [Leptolyngbyaceae cyanobacterium RM1_405_57]
MGERGKGKRLYLTLPNGIYEALERWAESEDNKPASLGAFIIEREVREAIANGKIPETKGKSTSTPTDLKAFLSQLACGELPANGQLVTLAHDLGVETEVLIELRDRVRRGDGNKKEEQTNGT